MLLGRLNRYEEAEAAYKEAIDLNPDFFHAYSEMARLQIKINRPDDARQTFRKMIQLDEAHAEENTHFLLQAHLFLGNQDTALSILETLPKRKWWTKMDWSFLLGDCHDTGLGTALADLMDQSAYADFLKPYSLAVRAAALGDTRIFRGAAQEIANMAEEVYKVVFGDASA